LKSLKGIKNHGDFTLKRNSKNVILRGCGLSDFGI
jgi:hypothetical protein